MFKHFKLLAVAAEAFLSSVNIICMNIIYFIFIHRFPLARRRRRGRRGRRLINVDTKQIEERVDMTRSYTIHFYLILFTLKSV